MSYKKTKFHVNFINLLNNGGKKNTVQLRQSEEAQHNEAEELLVVFYK